MRTPAAFSPELTASFGMASSSIAVIATGTTPIQSSRSGVNSSVLPA